MGDPSPAITYGLAVPDTREWERQLNKIPATVRDILTLELFLVSVDGVRRISPPAGNVATGSKDVKVGS